MKAMPVLKYGMLAQDFRKTFIWNIFLFGTIPDAHIRTQALAGVVHSTYEQAFSKCYTFHFEGVNATVPTLGHSKQLLSIFHKCSEDEDEKT